ncbi:MAG: MBOAT family protein [Lachnospiraceae bacterium]|nr:MBOAT family protein [Lachnospiraceae bacterium]
MVFNSVDFLLFFPIVLFVYFLIPKKVRYVWLLIVSYYFYMSWNPKYAVLIALSTVITYLTGLGIGKAKDKKIKNWMIAGSFVSNLGILFFFKYFDFALLNVNRVLGSVGIQALEKTFDVMLPIGISFYTFQALGYTMDVYRGEMRPEKNIFRYALFVSFFPLIAAGPIERSKNLLKQMQSVHTFRIWNYENITGGAALMLWGYFMKMVIADRLAIFVDSVFGNYGACASEALVLAAVFFAFQLYCDFGSYSLIAMGCAKIMGFSVMENFNTPYFALSVKEFWRRWHISLSSWFRDYLYIPLGGNRKGRVRKYINLMITFLISGLWHGASFSFVAWGGLHGLYQIIGEGLRPARERVAKACHINTESLLHKLVKGLITFALVDFAWIFFRCSSLTESVAYIKRMLTAADYAAPAEGALFTLGLSRLEFVVAIAGLVILLLVDLIRYRKGMQLYEYLNTKWLWLRWSVYIFLAVSIFLFGIYGPGYNAAEFIYFQF